MNVLVNRLAQWRSSLTFHSKDASRAQKIIMIFVAVYITCTRFLFFSSLPMSKKFLLLDLLAGVCAFFLYYALLWFLYRFLSNREQLLPRKSVSGKLRPLLFLLFFMIVLLPLLLTYLKQFPGGVSRDCLDQWEQVQSFTFDNWHPVLHTFFLWLLTRILNDYAFVVLVQLLLYSAALALLFAKLHAWGISLKWLLPALLTIALSISNRRIMQFLWKDCALSICIVFLLVCLVNLYFTKGGWLFGSVKNMVLFSVLIAITSLIRHNGFFYTLPVLFLLLFYWKAAPKRIINTILICALGILLIRGPMYSALQVTYPDNTIEESIGVPMVIMGDVFVKNPDALSDKTKSFLLQIATEEEWKQNYIPGDYNSIKWYHSSNGNTAQSVVQKTPLSDIIGMTLETIKNDWRNSFFAVRNMTSFVWDSKGNRLSEYGLYPPLDNNFGIEANEKINNIGNNLSTTLDFVAETLPKTLQKCLGFQILLLLLCFAVTFKKNGWSSLFLVLPVLCYNFGTMLLLCGSDVRFFHFNFLITLPVCLALLSSAPKEKIEKGETNREGIADAPQKA